jgi:hypothetical protein
MEKYSKVIIFNVYPHNRALLLLQDCQRKPESYLLFLYPSYNNRRNISDDGCLVKIETENQMTIRGCFE